MSHSSNSVPPVHFHQVDEELVTEKNAALQKEEEETKEHGMGPSGALATCINVSMGTGGCILLLFLCLSLYLFLSCFSTMPLLSFLRIAHAVLFM